MGTTQKRSDYVLLSYLAILLLFGLMMLTSASSAVGQERFGDNYFFIKRQLMFGVVPGIVAFLFFTKISYQTLKRLSMWLFFGSLLLLVLVLIPGIGSTYDTNARSWISLFGASFQPSEFAKLGIILFLSTYLSSRVANIQNFQQGFLVALGLGMVPIGLVVLQPDVGTTSIMFAILFGLLFLAGAKLSHLGGLAALGIVALAIMVLIAPYRAARLTTFLHPELDPQGQGYHINQAFLAIGSGGFFGLGFGHSRQKFQYLPEVHADSIYAIIAEEMGFLFAAGLIFLLFLIASRSLKIAKYAPDQFGRLLCGGIIIWFMTQSFLNIGAMVGLLPLTGVPLPFVSHGGTALMVVMAAAGMLLNVSRHIELS